MTTPLMALAGLLGFYKQVSEGIPGFIGTVAAEIPAATVVAGVVGAIIAGAVSIAVAIISTKPAAQDTAQEGLIELVRFLQGELDGARTGEKEARQESIDARLREVHLVVEIATLKERVALLEKQLELGGGRFRTEQTTVTVPVADPT